MREELLKLDRYQEQFHYLRKNRIETAAQLSMQYDAIQAEIDALTERRGQLYRQKRRGDGGGEIQTEIEQITTHLRALRRDLKLCARIEGDIPKSGRRWKPSAQTMQGGVLMKNCSTRT